MFARLTTIRVKTERIDEAIKLYKKNVVPEAKLQKGFRGTYLLVDRKIGKGVVITLWKSEEDAIANEENRYYQEQLIKFMNFFTGPPIREGYEVSVLV